MDAFDALTAAATITGLWLGIEALIYIVRRFL